MAIIITLIMILVLQLWRVEKILQSVCRNQLVTAQLLGKAHGIPVREKGKR